MEKDIVNVTVGERVTVKGHVPVNDLVMVRDRVTVVESATKSAGVTEKVKDSAVKIDMNIERREGRAMRQVIRKKTPIIKMSKKKARLDSMESLQRDSLCQGLSILDSTRVECSL